MSKWAATTFFTIAEAHIKIKKTSGSVDGLNKQVYMYVCSLVLGLTGQTCR